MKISGILHPSIFIRNVQDNEIASTFNLKLSVR